MCVYVCAEKSIFVRDVSGNRFFSFGYIVNILLGKVTYRVNNDISMFDVKKRYRKACRFISETVLKRGCHAIFPPIQMKISNVRYRNDNEKYYLIYANWIHYSTYDNILLLYLIFPHPVFILRILWRAENKTTILPYHSKISIKSLLTRTTHQSKLLQIIFSFFIGSYVKFILLKKI